MNRWLFEPRGVVKSKRSKTNVVEDIAFPMNVVFTNADSVLNKLVELHMFLDTEKPDLLAVVESNCNASIHDAILSHSGYELVRRNTTERRGGIVMYVTTKFKLAECNEMSCSTTDFQESLWYWIYYGRRSKVLVGTVYRKPNSSSDNDRKLVDIIEKATDISSEVIILGDFNLPEIVWTEMRAKSKMNEGYNTPVKFLDMVQQCGLYQHVTSATRTRGNQTPSLLDLVITSRRSCNDFSDEL